MKKDGCSDQLVLHRTTSSNAYLALDSALEEVLDCTLDVQRWRQKHAE